MTSLSALVKGVLVELSGDASETERRRRLQNELLERLDAEGLGVIAGQRPDREVLHAQTSAPRRHPLAAAAGSSASPISAWPLSNWRPSSCRRLSMSGNARG